MYEIWNNARELNTDSVIVKDKLVTDTGLSTSFVSLNSEINMREFLINKLDEL